MSLKYFQTTTTHFALIGMLLFTFTTHAQAAKGANKFLGNITTNWNIRSDFLSYWNQITPENESKWREVEGTRDHYSWYRIDRIRDFAKKNGIPWKFHTLVWGNQYPNWISGLSKTEQLEEVTEWMDTCAKRYPNVQMIDVVNEGYETESGKHAIPPFKDALGGNGSTGFDWIIKSFKMARERWPNAILIYNDYNIIEYENEVNWTVTLIEAMKKANAPIDAIGCQGHAAYKFPTSVVKSNIDKLAALGLPILISEYDIDEADDDKQKKIMEEQFTMFWNHPKIVGVTYWGYVVGSTWLENTGLKSDFGQERPALTWLIDYVKKNPNPPNDFPNFFAGVKINPRIHFSMKRRGTTQQMNVRQNGPLVTVTFDAAPNSSIPCNVYNLKGNVVHSVRFQSPAGLTHHYRFSTNSMPQGYYVVTVQNGDAIQKAGLVLTGNK